MAATLVHETMDRKFFNLSAITNRIQEILQPHIGKLFWVKAEISSGRERGGSFYCDLVETNEAKQIIAQMRCTIWYADLLKIRKEFQDKGMDLILDDGTLVGLQCLLQYNPKYGFSLRVVDADPSFALGELELKKHEILNRLTKEGLLEPNKKQQGAFRNLRTHGEGNRPLTFLFCHVIDLRNPKKVQRRCDRFHSQLVRCFLVDIVTGYHLEDCAASDLGIVFDLWPAQKSW